MLQIVFVLIIYIPLVLLVGRYVYQVTMNQKTVFNSFFQKIENILYKITGVKQQEMTGKQYVIALLLSNACMIIVSYLILRLQKYVFLNPNQIENMEPTLAFNTVISFMTNTNLQH